MGPDIGNELGHWESDRITAFNDEVLASAGSSWDDWLPFNPEWYQSSLHHDFVRRGREKLQEEFRDSSLFVLKDPRICRITSLWLEILAEEGVEPRIVLPVRSPIEVGESLNERDMMDPGYAHLLWLRHFLDAELATRGLRRLFFTYDQLLDDWRQLTARMKDVLGIIWPRMSASSAAEISGFLTSAQRHHYTPARLSSLGMSDWISRAYDISVRWSTSEEKDSERLELDRIRAELDAASPAFGQLLLPGSRSGIFGEGSKRRAALEQQLEEARARMNGVEAELNSVRDELVAVDGQRAQLLDQIGKVESSAQTEDMAEQLAQAENALREAQAAQQGLETDLVQKTMEVDRLRADLTHFADEVARLSEQERLLGQRLAQTEGLLNERTEQLAADAARIEDITAERQHAINRLADVESTLRQREEEIAQAWAELAVERDAKAALQSEVEHLAKDAEKKATLLQEERAWVFRLAGERKAAETRADALQAGLRAEQRELSATRHMLERLQARLEASNDREILARSEKAAAELALKELEVQLEIVSGRERVAVQALNDSLAQVPPAIPSDLDHQRAVSDEQFVALSEELERAHRGREELSRTVESQTSEIVTLRERLDRESLHVEEHIAEIANLTQMLLAEEQREEQRSKGLDWLQEVNRVLMGQPGWWALMPSSWRRPRELRRLSRRGLFDSEAYLARYPDVAQAGIDPLQHYISHGMPEGRQPIG